MHDVRASSNPRRKRYSAVTRHPPAGIGLLALVDSALFTAIGAMHFGLAIGDYSVPRAHWTAPIELFAAACLAIAAGTIWTRANLAREIAWIADGIALWSVILGVMAFSAGLDPCTPLTEVHYGMTAAVTFLSLWRLDRWQRGLSWPP